ncbi:MAG: Eco57I restriction-modification methylase domain-containing protein, partial [Bryobacterales bacterium]|nr:Eco57I restriction-modification methylase domain-containing protein [Bryobacterales bacterium]
LPNLETCCSTADTLCIELSDSKQTMQLGTDEWDKAIGDWQAARDLWVRTHSEDDKVEALREERRARKALKKLAEWRPSYDSSWLDTDFLTACEQPNSTDVRKLFVAPDGWDIVIGNPPYQLSNDRERERGQRLGYIARNNLYTMFIEAAMEACKEHGCVTLVVPHSIVFRREESYKKLRKKIEEFADRIEIRTFDNRPKPVFPHIPWVKIHQTSSESRQRVTILSARKGVSHNPIITSRGLIRLDAERRREILRADQDAIVQPRFHRQWTQAPSAATVQLLEKMWAEAKDKVRMQDKATRTVAFPQTAMYFVPCLPVELSPLKNPKLYKLDDDEFFWPWIGLYNSHLFHAYWLMTGDAFHVTGTDYSSVAPPAGWKDESLRAQIERAAKLLVSKKNLDACRVAHAGSGGSKWPNMNFHGRQEGREIVSILDRLLIEAYDLEEQPLLSHVRMMRTGSAHDLSALH